MMLFQLNTGCVSENVIALLLPSRYDVGRASRKLTTRLFICVNADALMVGNRPARPCGRASSPASRVARAEAYWASLANASRTTCTRSADQAWPDKAHR